MGIEILRRSGNSRPGSSHSDQRRSSWEPIIDSGTTYSSMRPVSHDALKQGIREFCAAAEGRCAYIREADPGDLPKSTESSPGAAGVS